MGPSDWIFYPAILTLLLVLIVLYRTARSGSHKIGRASLLRFFLGDGWWTVWHGLLYLSLVSIGAAYIMAGRDDGAIPALLVLFFSACLSMLITLVNAILCSASLYGDRRLKYLAGPFLAFAAWFALLALLFLYHQVFIYFAFGSDRIVGALFFLGFILAIGLLNLFAIQRFRQ